MTLTPSTASIAGGVAPQASYQTSSSASGVFRLAEVKEGSYTASFRKAGFMGPSPDKPARKPFLVRSPGDHVVLDVEVMPGASLQGRVVDGEGNPAPNVRVELSKFRRRGTGTTTTDALGSFVFETVDPGPYLLIARPILAGSSMGTAHPKAVFSVPVPPAEGTVQIWSPTYFPSVLDRASAERIGVRAGTELSGYEIRLRTVPVHRIKGFVRNEDGSPAARVPVKLTPADPWEPQEAEVSTSNAGTFEFPAVRPGEWRLIAESTRGGLELRGFGAAVVKNRDEENLEIRLSPPFTLNGFVERQEPRDSEGNRKLSGVYLVPTDGPHDQQVSGFHKQDGTLEIQGVMPGLYLITPVGFVPGYFVASVLLGDREVMGQEVNLANGLTPIRVIYKPNAGRVSGTVEKGEGSTVVLVPKDEAFLDGQFIRSAKCTASGNFVVSDLRPGDYCAFSFDHVDFDALEDPTFVRNLISRAATVQVKQGEIATMELQVMPWPE